MNFPPSMLVVSWWQPSGRAHRLWFPLFVLWPLAAVGFLILAPLLVIWGLLFGFHPLRMVMLLAGLCCELRGLMVDVEQGATKLYVSLK